jgi:hypothetical protein
MKEVMKDQNGTMTKPEDFEKSYQSKLAAMKSARAPKEQLAEQARRKRDLDELEAVYAALDECEGTFEDNVLRVPDAPPTLPGHIVLKRPAASATRQFKAIVLSGSKIDADRGASERRVNATKTYLLNCRVYPPLEQLEELLNLAAGIPESAIKIIHRLADLGAQDEAKE